MPAQFDGINITVFQHAVGRCAEKLGERVVKLDAGSLVEKGLQLHGVSSRGVNRQPEKTFGLG